MFICHNVVPETLRRGRLFSYLITGQHSAADGSFMGDLDGPNVANSHELSELRQQYYVWKNLLGRYDYVGFEHHRRVFFIDPQSDMELETHSPAMYRIRRHFLHDPLVNVHAVPTADFETYLDMRANLNAGHEAAFDRWVRNYDVIAQRPVNLSLREQWMTTSLAEFWPVLVQAVERNSYFRDRPCKVDFDMRAPSFCNMFIMRSEVFDQYMTFLSEAHDFLRANVTMSERLMGHFTERLFNFWLYQKRLESPLFQLGYLPYLHLEKTLDAPAPSAAPTD